MNYYSEQEIRDIILHVLTESGIMSKKGNGAGQKVPVEISGRHVHLNREAMSVLFGPEAQLTHKRDLSQPGQFLAEERVKLVTAQGQIAHVSVLGPLRDRVQVELSRTDARSLGIDAPTALSGQLAGAANVMIIGPKGSIEAREAAIVAKAHVHMTPADAKRYGVQDGQHVSVRVGTERVITLNDVVVRVSDNYALAVHIDTDEANAAQVGGLKIAGILQTNR